jgi:2-(1,2-epoxy-1,2-dihydrophenyl)acetyl-CoA isomerase
MDGHSILFELDNGVAKIVLNRPRALNALDSAMIEELADSLKRASNEPEVRVLILTGSGRAFCFGADISVFRKAQDQENSPALEKLLEKAQKAILLLAEMPKPTIAALNGFASGLGLDLALACDVRIAADRVKVSETFVSMGLVPDGGGTFFLPRLVGSGKAAEMIFTGEPIPAQEAERIGLINRVVPAPELEKTAQDLARRLAKGPSLAIRLAKQALKKNLHGNLAEALTVEAQFQKMCFQSFDHQEAVGAFLERREPIFQGK